MRQRIKEDTLIFANVNELQILENRETRKKTAAKGHESRIKTKNRIMKEIKKRRGAALQENRTESKRECQRKTQKPKSKKGARTCPD